MRTPVRELSIMAIFVAWACPLVAQEASPPLEMPALEAGPPSPADTIADVPAAQSGVGGDETTAESDPSASGEQTAELRVIVIDAAAISVEPVVGRIVTDRIRRTAEELGYAVMDAASTVAAAQRLRMPYPPTPADLWRVTWVAQSQRGVFARVWATEGRYVVELTAASLDGTGPFFGRETASADELRETIDALVRRVLPAPSTWDAQGQPRVAHTGRQPWMPRPRLELAHPEGRGVRFPDPPIRNWAVTLSTEAAIGTTQGGFYNHLVGARLDLRFTQNLMIGAYIGYTNLQGRQDRVHNLLLMLLGEFRTRVSPSVDLTIPLRVGFGYLPYNGPVIRLSGGLNYAFSSDFEIGADLIAPTFWILADDIAVSIDMALEATYRFP